MTTATQTQVVNLTPHSIAVVLENGDQKVFEKTGVVARITCSQIKVGMIDGIDLMTPAFGQTEGLPEEEAGKIFIVSAMVRNANPDRKDLVSPGDQVRDENGNVIGCRNFHTN